MQNKQKGFVNIILIIVIVALACVAGYFAFRKSTTVIPIVPPQTNIPSDPTANWKTYHNDTYGFELKYPPLWVLRDGNKDYKVSGLNNFYQFCNKVITVPNESLGSNDNFVGNCEGEFLRVNIWKPTTEIKIITNDFATLKLDRENKITIGEKPASEFEYSGNSQVLGGAHVWHLFVIKTDDFIYSINGDSCMDDKTECNQVISTFKFI